MGEESSPNSVAGSIARADKGITSNMQRRMVADLRHSKVVRDFLPPGKDGEVWAWDVPTVDEAEAIAEVCARVVQPARVLALLRALVKGEQMTPYAAARVAAALGGVPSDGRGVGS